MAVTLNGYTKAIIPQTQVREGLGELRNASKEKAQEHLTQLRSDLQSKTGVVRLLHTTSTNANQEMKFKNAGGFKSMFLNGNKLQQSGEVIRDLLKSAGLSEAKVNEFDAYVQARGGQGVKAQKVLQYIDAMRAEKGNSAEDALSKFGVDLRRTGKILGEGTFGLARTVRYRGEEFVYKQPSENAIDQDYDTLGKLILTDASGQPIDPNKAKANIADEDEKSYQQYLGDSIIQNQLPLQKINNQKNDIRGKQNVFESLRSDASSTQFENSGIYDAPIKGFILQQILGVDGYDDYPLEPLQAKPLEESDPVIPKFKVLIEEEPDVEPSLLAEPPPVLADQANKIQPAQQEPNLPGTAPTTLAATGAKLGRTGIANAIRVKDLPQIITPTVVVVKETASNGSVQHHAVAGQKTLKDWARTQPTDSAFDVVGLLMPKAAGNNPIEYPKDAKEDAPSPPPKVHVSRSDLKPMAASALNLLQGMASHGFIHGDIKPENLMWDAKSKTLQLIDNDSLHKVSKKAGSEVGKGLGPTTIIYTNPVALDKRYHSRDSELAGNAQLGLGRDLYSMGLVLLETSLRAKGQDQKAESLINGITFKEEPVQKIIYLMRNKSYNRGIETLEKEQFAPGSVEDFARTCIIESIRHEEARLNNGITSFERYDPSQPGNDQHLLAKLEHKFAEMS